MGGLAKWRFGGFAAVARSSDLFDAVTHGSDGTQTQLEAQRLERWRRDEDSSLYFVLRRWLKFANATATRTGTSPAAASK